MNNWAIIDDNGIIVDGCYEDIMEIWNDEKHDYKTKIEGDLVLIKICGCKKKNFVGEKQV